MISQIQHRVCLWNAIMYHSQLQLLTLSRVCGLSSKNPVTFQPCIFQLFQIAFLFFFVAELTSVSSVSEVC